MNENYQQVLHRTAEIYGLDLENYQPAPRDLEPCGCYLAMEIMCDHHFEESMNHLDEEEYEHG